MSIKGRQQRSDLLASSTFSAFIAVAFLLIHAAHLSWFDKAVEENSSKVSGVYIDKNTSWAYIVLFSSISAAVQFVITYHSFHRGFKHGQNDIAFPTLTLVTQASIGLVSILLIPLAFNWTNIVAIPVFAGLLGASHNIFLYFNAARKEVEERINRIKDRIAFVKSLELEYNTFQSMIQWFVWAVAIFFTGGVVSVAFNPFDTITPALHSVILQNLVLLSIYGLLGLWFGVMMPILIHLRFIRETIVKISFKDTS